MENLSRLLADARGELPPSPLDLDTITARGRRIVRRRRWSVAAVGLAALALLPFVRLEHRPAPPVATELVFTARLAGYASGAYHVGASTMVTPGYEVAPISHDEAGGRTRVVGSVEVYRPGAFDPRLFQHGTPVTVAGRPGFLRTDRTTLRYGTDGNRQLATIDKPALAWPYADDAWAVVRAASDGPVPYLPTDAIERIAARFTLGDPTPVRLPFRVGYLPPGYALQAAGRTGLDAVRDTTSGRLGEVTLAPPRSFTGLTGTLTPAGISIVEERQPTGAGHRGTACDSYGCYREVAGTDYYIGVLGKLPAAELRKTADALTPADPGRPAAWFTP